MNFVLKWIKCIFITAFLHAASAQQLLVTSPNVMKIDTLEAIHIDGFDLPNNGVNVELKLQTYPDRDITFSDRRAVVRNGRPMNVRLIVTIDNLGTGSLATKKYVYLVVECGMLQFYRESIIQVTGVQGYLFLQTDKPIYTPDQVVSLRVVSLNADMNPSNTEFTIDVKNPRGILFRRYDKQRATNGFVQEKFKVPKITAFGNWTVETKYKNKYQEHALDAIKFEVRPYVLPTFSVRITAPNFILSSHDEVSVQLNAKYVFGNEVVGSAEVFFSLQLEDGSRKIIGMKQVKDFKGEKTISITREDFRKKNLWFPLPDSRLVVEAIVTERATGKRETEFDMTARFVTSPYVVSFNRTSKYFKPGLPFLVNIDVKYASDVPAPRVPMFVAATAKTTRANRVHVFRNNAASNRFNSDSNGRVSITLDIPFLTEDVEIQVTTSDYDIGEAHQASEGIRLEKQKSSTHNYLSIQIMNNENRLSVGDKMKTRVDFSDNSEKMVIYTVLARGKVVEKFIRNVDGQTAHEDITVTATMSPQVRLLVYYAKDNGIIADSVVVDVEYRCKSELSITPIPEGENTLRPKSVVKFKIRGKGGAWVSLLAVDKAVHLLRNNDFLSREKMFRAIKEMDHGCGPGGGRDSMSVFKNAGMSFLTNVVTDIPGDREEESCSSRSSRKTRSVNRGRRDGRRKAMLDILVSLNEEETDCCYRGIEKAQEDSRSCDELSQLEVAECQNLFKRCCGRQKALILPKGRSIGEADDGLVDIDENEVEIETREYFRETWINEFFQIPDNNEYEVRRNLPDSITTWVISGVSVASSDGMCVVDAFDIAATKTFFVKVDLPYAAIRNEQLQVKATVYNFQDRAFDALVYMETDAEGLCYIKVSEKRSKVTRIRIGPGRGASVSFPIVPLKIGEYKITVSAIAALAGDRVVRTLRVRAEGVRRTGTESTRLDPLGVMGSSGQGGGSMQVSIKEGKQTINVPLEFPDDAIPGTEACELHFSGNLIGPMVPSADLDMGRKIRQPTGCGEQTMFHMGPLVYTTRYMLSTGRLSGDLERIAYGYIKDGFDNELRFKNKDGAYAIFSHSPPSAWLTAFVSKVFCQASEFSQIGEQAVPHVRESINWLIRNALNEDGSFHETSSVHDARLYGQNFRNNVTFTAFVVEALSKCSKVVDLKSVGITDDLGRAVRYLERYIEDRLTYAYRAEPYTTAIVAYALTLQNSKRRFVANELLRKKSSYDSATGMRFWNDDGRITNDNDARVWYRQRAPAIYIETASYALLNQLALGSSEDYLSYSGPIAAWLIRQRTKYGAFISTADTVLGLEALTEYSLKALSQVNPDMKIKVFTNNMDQEPIILNEENANTPVVIRENLPIGDVLTITAEGSGVGQLQIECTHNSPAKQGEICTFDLDITAREYNTPPGRAAKSLQEIEAEQLFFRDGAQGATDREDNIYVVELNIKVRYTGEGNNVGMSILEVTLLSGFGPVIPDLEELLSGGLIDRYEVTSDAVLIYLSGVSKMDPITIAFRTHQEHKIGEIQPVSVTLYDYYEPDIHQCTKFYHPKNGSALLNTFCDQDEEKRNVCTCAETSCAKYWGFDKSRGGPRLRRKDNLITDACYLYDYAMKIRAGVVEKGTFHGLAQMKATVLASLKKGGMVYKGGEEVIFVWESKCDNPDFVAGRPYLIMGMDGRRYVDRLGKQRIRYVLDSRCFVTEWVSRKQYPLYSAGLYYVGRTLAGEGCQH